jgi:hypothetical protein
MLKKSVPPKKLRRIVEAVIAGAEEVRRRVERAESVQRDLIGMSALVLREQGFTDSYIAERLGMRPIDIAECTRLVRPRIGPDCADPIRDEIEDLWRGIGRFASQWVQVDCVTLSREVVRRNGIDIGDSPLSVGDLDTSGAEFVHQGSSEKIILYSLQRWNGTPVIANGQFAGWDNVGQYNVEFVSTTGERGTFDLPSLGLSPDVVSFSGDLTGRTGTQTVGDAFERIVLGIRRTYGVVPPYMTAKWLYLRYPSG